MCSPEYAIDHPRIQRWKSVSIYPDIVLYLLFVRLRRTNNKYKTIVTALPRTGPDRSVLVAVQPAHHLTHNDGRVQTDLGQAKLPVRVVESFELFPTWYSVKNGPLFVGNLEYLFQQAGGQVPYQVGLKTNPNQEPGQAGPIELSELNVRVLHWDASRPAIHQMQQRPEQQGTFGFLFIGFIAAAVLTVIGFLLYTLYSYKRRFIEFGVLRASGLSRMQMSSYLALELVFLIVFGGAAGTGLGALISRWFIPFLQVGSDLTARVPPFEILIDWSAIIQMCVVFGLLFTISFGVLIAMLQRLKIFLAIKMGETL
jgi:putative ABC transport system permease protein